MLFEECDRSSPIKNFIDRLTHREVKENDISVKFTAESTKKYVTFR